MSEPRDPAELVEEIEVEPVAEPEEAEQGVIDPADNYAEGVVVVEALDERDKIRARLTPGEHVIGGDAR